MNNLVKFVQAGGLAIMVPSEAVSIVRTVTAKEKEAHPKARSAAYIVLHSGIAQHLLLRESFGFILKRAGGASAERLEVAGPDGTKVSIPRALISTAVEVEEKGEKTTVINTHVQMAGGLATITSTEPLADIYDALSADVSDQESVEDEEEVSA